MVKVDAKFNYLSKIIKVSYSCVFLESLHFSNSDRFWGIFDTVETTDPK